MERRKRSPPFRAKNRLKLAPIAGFTANFPDLCPRCRHGSPAAVLFPATLALSDRSCSQLSAYAWPIHTKSRYRRNGMLNLWVCVAGAAKTDTVADIIHPYSTVGGTDRPGKTTEIPASHDSDLS